MRSMSRQLTKYSLLILTAIAWAHSQTRESDLMLARSVKLASTTMGYRLFVPKNYSSSQKYPLVVALHGVGERGTDNRGQVDREDLAHPWIEDSIQARVPHFVMIPQCPPDPLTWGGMGGAGGLSETGKGIFDAIDSLKRAYNLDTNRFYIAGLSMGGAGTYHLLQQRPGFFAAAAPCAAGGDTASATIYAKTPWWGFHGSLDVRAPSTDPGNRLMAKALEGRGIKVVRFVSQAAITTPSLTAYSSALRNGTKAVDLVAKNPTGISWDSLSHAVEGGANYLYSELTGGDHRSGWMIAWHNPLLAKWMFSKVKGGSAVAIAPKPQAPRQARKAALVLGQLPDLAGLRAVSPTGRTLDARARTTVTGFQGPVLLLPEAP